MRRRFLLVFAAFVAGASAVSPQELRPSDSVFAGEGLPLTYQLAIRDGLLGEPAVRRCQLVAIPSFSQEWVVYIVRAKDGGPRVIWKRFRQQLYRRLFAPPPPPPPPGQETRTSELAAPAQAAALPDPVSQVESASAPIDPALSDLLHQVWWQLLGRVSYASSPGGLDGTIYFVSDWSSESVGGFRSGTTWSPEAGSRPAALVDLAERMADLARARTDAERRQIEQELRIASQALLRRTQ